MRHARRSLVLGLIVALVCLSGIHKVGANMIITTVPESSVVVADDTTEYKMRVIANSTASDVADKSITGAEWDLTFPSYINITRTSLPDGNPSTNGDDFFYDILMMPAFNRIDSTVVNNELDDNVRGSNDGFTGAVNRVGDLGWYFFTVNSDAPLGEAKFGLHAVVIIDSQNTEYRLSNDNLGIENQPFTVTGVPEPATMSLLGAGALGLAWLRKRRAPVA